MENFTAYELLCKYSHEIKWNNACKSEMNVGKHGLHDDKTHNEVA